MPLTQEDATFPEPPVKLPSTATETIKVVQDDISIDTAPSSINAPVTNQNAPLSDDAMYMILSNYVSNENNLRKAPLRREEGDYLLLSPNGLHTPKSLESFESSLQSPESERIRTYYLPDTSEDGLQSPPNSPMSDLTVDGALEASLEQCPKVLEMLDALENGVIRHRRNSFALSCVCIAAVAIGLSLAKPNK